MGYRRQAGTSSQLSRNCQGCFRKNSSPLRDAALARARAGPAGHAGQAARAAPPRQTLGLPQSRTRRVRLAQGAEVYAPTPAPLAGPRPLTDTILTFTDGPAVGVDKRTHVLRQRSISRAASRGQSTPSGSPLNADTSSCVRRRTFVSPRQGDRDQSMRVTTPPCASIRTPSRHRSGTSRLVARRTGTATAPQVSATRSRGPKQPATPTHIHRGKTGAALIGSDHSAVGTRGSYRRDRRRHRCNALVLLHM
jgi:hypothetical protein